MLMYHGTDLKTWYQIQNERMLWGVRDAPSRCTYLATSKEEAEHYGPVVLEVNFDPSQYKSNWIEGCWQVRVYDPISLTNVQRIR